MRNNSTTLEGLSFGASTYLQPLGAIKLSSNLNSDYIIPETLSDTQAILLTSCDVVIKDITQNGQTVTASGKVLYNLLLLGDDGTIGNVKLDEDFEIKDLIDGLSDDSILICKGAFSECESRMINPRKINLNSHITVKVDAYNEKDVSPEISGTETLEDDMCLKRRHGEILTAQTTTVSEKDIPVSHDITLDGNFPPIAEILFSRIKTVPNEINTRGNRIELKFKAIYSAVYRSEEGNIFALSKSFILEKAIEFDAADTFDWSAFTCSDDLSSEIAKDNYGDSKIIEIDFSYDVVLNGIRNTTVDSITDMYSTEYECETVENRGESVVYNRSYRSSLSVNASTERGALSAENVRNVLIGNAVIKESSAEYSPEKNKLIVNATALIFTVCENNITSDDDIRYSSHPFDYQFKCELDVGEHNENTDYSVEINISDTRFRQDQNNLYCDLECNIFVESTTKCETSYISNATVNKNSPVTRIGAPITLCYPGGTETLWDIAKYYKVSTNEIIISNSLSSEDISDRKVLLIPSYRTLKPVSSKFN